MLSVHHQHVSTSNRTYASVLSVAVHPNTPLSMSSSSDMATTQAFSLPKLDLATSKAWQSGDGSQNSLSALDLTEAITKLLTAPLEPTACSSEIAPHSSDNMEERGRTRKARPDWTGSTSTTNPADFLPAKSSNPLTGRPFQKLSNKDATTITITPSSLPNPLEVRNRLLLQRARVAKIQRVKRNVIEGHRKVPEQTQPEASPPVESKRKVQISTIPQPNPTPSPLPSPVKRKKRSQSFIVPRQPLIFEHSQYLLVLAIETRRKVAGKPDFFNRGKSLPSRMEYVRKPAPAFSVRGCRGRNDMAARMAGPSPLRQSWGLNDMEA